MRFVRKPKPYTRGRGAVRFPTSAQKWTWSQLAQWFSGSPSPSRYQSPAQPPRKPFMQLRPTRSTYVQAHHTPPPYRNPLARQTATSRQPSQVGAAFGPMPQPRWLSVLAGVGGVVCLVVGGSMVWNQVTREAQFQSVAAHLDVLRPAGTSTTFLMGTP